MRHALLSAAARGALAAAALLAASPAADARCVSTPTGPLVLSTSTRVPIGGGVLVETHAGLGNEAAAPHACAVVVGGLAVEPEALAPGLVVYRIPLDATRATLTDGPGTVRIITVNRAMAKARTPRTRPPTRAALT